MNEENLARIEAFVTETGRLVRALEAMQDELMDLRNAMIFSLDATPVRDERQLVLEAA